MFGKRQMGELREERISENGENGENSEIKNKEKTKRKNGR